MNEVTESMRKSIMEYIDKNISDETVSTELKYKINIYSAMLKKEH